MSYSLFQVTFFPPLFRDLFFKKYTYNKIMYLSEKYNWNRQKEFDNLIYIFSPMEIHTNKNFNKKLFYYIFYHSEVTRNTLHNFSMLPSGYFYATYNAKSL